MVAALAECDAKIDLRRWAPVRLLLPAGRAGTRSVSPDPLRSTKLIGGPWTVKLVLATIYSRDKILQNFAAYDHPEGLAGLFRDWGSNVTEEPPL
jgi:hypothetical protein